MKTPAALFLIFLCSLHCRADVAADVLEEMNFARLHPQEYARTLAARTKSPPAETIHFLMKTKPGAPIQFSEPLARAAQDHLADRNARGHRGADGSQPWNRMARHGQWLGSAGENISYGTRSAKSIVAALIIDAGVPGRGHRKNIFNPRFSVAGIAFGSRPAAGAICIIDFAGGFIENSSSIAAR